MTYRNVVLSLLALATIVSPATAQDYSFFSQVFKEIHSITLYGQTARLPESSGISPRKDCIVGFCGAGIETLFDLTPPDGTHLELGLGASFLGGLGADEPSLDLRGSVRTFPSLSGYLTGERVLGRAVQPYVGLNIGLSELWNAHAWDLQRRRSGLKAQTFEWGGTGGLYFNFEHFDGLFAEASYRRRVFSGVEYTLPAGDAVLPELWPREIDLSGWQLSVGWQLDLKKKPPPPRPVYAGVWYATALNQDSLPAIVSHVPPQAEGGEAKASRRELTSALLSVTGDPARFCLRLNQRDVPIDKEGRPIAPDRDASQTVSGAFQVADEGTLTITPELRTGVAALPPPPANGWRLGDQLLLSIPGSSNHVLFRRINAAPAPAASCS